MLNMKNKLAKRIMAFVLSGAMVISGLAPSGMTAYAAEASTEISTETVEESFEETEENDAEVVFDNVKEETPDEDSGADVKEEDDAAEDVNEEASREEAAKENASTREVVEEIAESTVERRTEKADAEETTKEEVNKVTSFGFKAEELSGNVAIGAEETVGGCTVKASDKKSIAQADANVTINGKTFTKKIKFGGAGTSSGQIIYFTTDGAGTLKVYGQYGKVAGETDVDKKIGLYPYDKSGGTLGTVIGEGQLMPRDNSDVELSFTISEAGTYCIGGIGGGSHIYGVYFEGEGGSAPPPEASSAVEESSSVEESSEEGPSIPDSEKHTVWVVGDSTVSSFNDNYYYPRYGYGTQIQNYLDGYYKVENLALSGRSSISYMIDEKTKEVSAEYKKLTDEIAEGDVLIIGFGHNDEKQGEDDRFTDPTGDWQTEGSFAYSLYNNYVKKAEDVGATAIICTPIVRRTTGTYTGSVVHITSDKTVTDKDGNDKLYKGGSYPDAIKKLGEDKGVKVVDLTTLTKERWESLGNDGTLKLHSWTNHKDSSVDNTHLNIYGAKVVAYMLATEIAKFEDLDIASHIKTEGKEPTEANDLKPNPNFQIPSGDGYVPPTGKSEYWENYGIFKGTVFGTVNKAISDTQYHQLNTDSDGNMHIAVLGDSTKVSDTDDGRAMYYYQIPATSTFEFSAKAKINAINAHGQVAFGLMARDDMFIDAKGEGILSDYVAAGTFGKSSTNSFMRKDTTLTKGPRLDADVQVGETYTMSIVKNSDGYACTFGDNATQSGGYDFQLTTIDEKYQYIGMFVARNADITFSDIKLIVDGEEIDIMDTTVTPPDPGPSGDDDLSVEGDGGNVSVTGGLLKGKKYGYKDVATFEVLRDMPFTEGVTNDKGEYDPYAITVDGVEYSGCVQGSGGSAPDSNVVPGPTKDGDPSAFKITAVKDSKITFIVRQNNKNYWFTDGANTSETLQNIPKDKQEVGGASHTFYMREGHTYYFYAGGSKVMVADIAIAKSGEADSGWPFSPEENSSQPTTEGSSQPTTEGSSQPTTEGSSQPTTEGSSEPGTGEEHPDTPSTKIPADEKIKTISINDKTKITIEAADVVYAKKQPYAITVTYKYEKKVGDNTQTYQQQLTEGLHYTVDAGSEDLSSEGVKTVTIKGTGKKTDLGTFINEEKTTYEVVAKKAKSDISKERNISLDKSDTKQSYTGNYITPIPNIGIEAKNAEGKDNYKVVYKNNVNVGKASVTVIGQGDYYGTKVLPFTIAKTDLSKAELDITASNATITGSLKAYTAVDKTTNSSFEYKGAPVTLNTFKIVLKGSGKALRPQEDYTIAYKKNAQAGKATLTIKGANNFSGSIKIDYDIVANTNVSSELEKFAPDKVTYESALPAEYSSKGARLTEINLGNGITLKENTDYKVKYGKDCKDVTAGQTDLLTVTITGAGSYKNVIARDTPVAIKVVKGKFHIKDNTIVDAKKAASPDKLVTAAKIMDASGAKVKPAAVTLEKYEAPLTTIKVIPSDADNYETTTLPCRVATKLSSVKLAKNAKIADQPFDGVNSVTLTEQRIAKYIGLEAKDIRIVSYKNNNKLGSATVTIEGTESGQYYGTRNLKFKISLTASDRDPEEEETSPSGGSTENPSEPSTGDAPNPSEPSTGDAPNPSEPSTGDVPNPSEPSSGDDTNPSEPSSVEDPDTEGSSSADPDNPTPPEVSGKRIDVWDFGAKQEGDSQKYKNNITASELSGKLTPNASDKGKNELTGGTGNVIQFGDLSIKYGSGDRIYADPDKVKIDGIEFPALNSNYKKAYDDYTAAGGWYSNGARDANAGYALIENVQAGDKIIAYMGNHHSAGTITFNFAELKDNTLIPLKDAEIAAAKTFNKFVFIAENTGTYKIYQKDKGTAGKPMYNRIVRIPAVSVSGNIDLDGNTISNYGLKFINQTDRNLPSVMATVAADGSFTAQLSAGYTYRALLTDAAGYGIVSKENADKVELTDDDAITGKSGLSFKVAPQETFTYSGTIAGFSEDYDISKLQITMTPTRDFDTNPVELTIDKTNKTFSAKLEPDIKYVFEMEGVNDYEVKTPSEILKEDKGDLTDQTITVGLKDMYDVAGGFIGLEDSVTVTALSFTNVEDDYSYDAVVADGGYTIKLRDGEYLANATVSDETYSTKTHVVVAGGMVSQDLLFVAPENNEPIAYIADIYVGYPKQENNYDTVTEAVKAASRMKNGENARTESERVTIHIAPGTYREQIIVDAPYISFVNDTSEEVLLTWYYGIGYVYYSAGQDGFYNAENAYDKFTKHSVGRWGTSVNIRNNADGFRAEGITFENSFNRYITDEELADGVQPEVKYSPNADTTITFERKNGVDVTSKEATERAAAVAIEKNANNLEFYNCKFYSSQDTLYTSGGPIYFKNCLIEGQTDYIYGSGSCVFDACELSWKGYSTNTQGGYITANSPRTKDIIVDGEKKTVRADDDFGYLFRNCTITANTGLPVKAGYFGRPWGATAQVIFMNTKLQNTDMIVKAGWYKMAVDPETPDIKLDFYEYNTTSLDGASVDTSGRKPTGSVLTDVSNINVSDYFGTWTPVHYIAESTDGVSFSAEPTLSDNGDINVPNPGHTLTVNYALNGDNAKNDVSTIKWYIMDDQNGTNAKSVKASTASDKTYKISKEASGKYIKVEVKPETVDGRTGEAKSVVLSTVIGNNYVDPSSGSDITVGDGINIYLAGDSTVKDYSAKGKWNGGKQLEDLGSWGEYIQSFFDESEVTVQNFAQGGRSSRSFINDDTKKAEERKFSVIKDNISEGDYLFIQFGHNDSSVSSSKADVYTPIGEKTDGKYPYTAGAKDSTGKYPDYYTWESGAVKWIDDGTQGTGTYCWFLQQYVDMALEKGAIPVIMTPVARMQYSSDGNKTHHKDDGNPNSYYWEAAKQVYEDNKAKGVLFIDTYELTTELFNGAYNDGGEARGKEIMSISDGTHNNKLGGMVEAMLVAEAIQGLNTPISYAVKTPSQVSGSTIAGKTVFSIGSDSKFEAYEQKFTGTKENAAYTEDTFTTKSTYWSNYGNTKLENISKKAGELADSNISESVAAAPKATSEMSDADGKTIVTVTLSSATENAKIYYTDDGVTNPKKSDGANADDAKEYDATTKIVLEEDTTIKAFAMAENKTSSKVVTFKFSVKPDVQAPTATTEASDAIESGAVIVSGTVIKLATTTENAEIRYTMGSGSKLSDPGINSPLYNDEKGLTITSSTTIKAVAIKNGVKSDVVTFTFTVSKMQEALNSLSLVIGDGSQSLQAAS